MKESKTCFPIHAMLRLGERTKTSRNNFVSQSLITLSYQPEPRLLIRFAGVQLPPFEKIKSTLRKRRLACLLPQAASTKCTSNSYPAKEDTEEEMATHYIARKVKNFQTNLK